MRAPLLFAAAVVVAMSFSGAADAQMMRGGMSTSRPAMNSHSFFHPSPFFTPQMRNQFIARLRANPTLRNEFERRELIHRDLSRELARDHFFSTFGFPWLYGSSYPYAASYPLSSGYSSNPGLYSGGYPSSGAGYNPSY